MLKTNEISFSYNNKKYFNYPNIDCKDGDTFLITGKSGCGKTTLLHILAGLITNYSGVITINETTISNFSTRKLDQFRGNNIGVIFQKSHFINSLNIYDNIKIATKQKINTSRIKEISNSLSINQLLYMLPRSLSAGELQRVSIVRALINSPSLLLADEPTSSLDDENTNAVIDLLKEQAKLFNCALVIVTHDQRLKNAIQSSIELI